MIEYTQMAAVSYRDATRLPDGTVTEFACAACDATWPAHRWECWPIAVFWKRRAQSRGRWGIEIGVNRHGQRRLTQVWAWGCWRLRLGSDRYQQHTAPERPFTCPACGARYLSAERYVELLGRQARGPRGAGAVR